MKTESQTVGDAQARNARNMVLISRVGIGVAFGIFAATKIASGSLSSEILFRRSVQLPVGLLGLVNHPVAQAFGSVVECALAILILSPAWRLGAVAVTMWTSALIGLTMAFALTGTEVSACQCFGTAKVQEFGHWTVLLGMALLTTTVMSAGLQRGK